MTISILGCYMLFIAGTQYMQHCIISDCIAGTSTCNIALYQIVLLVPVHATLHYIRLYCWYQYMQYCIILDCILNTYIQYCLLKKHGLGYLILCWLMCWYKTGKLYFYLPEEHRDRLITPGRLKMRCFLR